MALFRKSTSGGRGGGSWMSGLLGGREIENRVDENFPSWQEYSQQKVDDAQARAEEEKRLELPPHRIYISSPLHGNFLYFTLVMVALALGFYSPELAPVLIYAAIGVVLVICLFVVFRDGLFFHIEALRLVQDGEMINKHTRGPQNEQDERGLGFLRSFSRKGRNHKVFRSRLLQIHYQNVLRTFEQGNRRTWVDQDASIADLHTLLTQRGMKLTWTMIEVLPQLGLLGTLLGLMRMFMAFRGNTANPELEVLSGFAVALGTTVLANIFVLILRPLYMRNERSMHEILTTIQTLMATFILPTQQSVLERTLMTGFGRSSLALPPSPEAPARPLNENRLFQSLDELTHALGEFTETQHQVESGVMARETAGIAQEVKETLRAFHEAVDRNHLEKQQRSIEQLTEAVQGLAATLNHVEGAAGGPSSERIAHDLMQLRLLTHDTLLLLEQIAGRLGPVTGRNPRLLSMERAVRRQAFPESEGAPGLTRLEEEPPRPPPDVEADPSPGDPESSRVRLFK
jgi:biopolymer transport protein ExbB/TolQ